MSKSKNLIEINTDEAGLASAADIQNANSLLEAASQLVISDGDAADEAGLFVKNCMAAKKALEERRKAITKPLDESKKSVMDLFREPIRVIEEAREQVKGKISAYVREQERIAAEERRKAEEKARREAEKAAQKAAKYEEEGREDLAEKWREREAEAEVAPISAPAAKTTVEGVKMRTFYSAEVTDTKAFLAAVAAGAVPITLVEIKQGALNKFVGQFKGDIAIPGVTVRAEKRAS